MPTEKECVLREQTAYKVGVRTMYYAPAIPATDETAVIYTKIWDQASSRYPLPKVTRPRLVQFPGGLPSELLRVANGRVEYTACGPGENGGWIAAMPHVIGANLDKKWQSPGLLRVIADLIENPTEEVEDA